MNPSRPRPSRTPTGPLLVVLVLVALLGLTACSDGGTETVDFEDLTAGQRVYDETGDSLSGEESTRLQERLDTLAEETGADVIAYVRELDADPEETFEQVEALQQAWVDVAGVDQDTAGAILVNREPGTDDEARAGVFVGSTYDDGNVPQDEQEAIVEDALVPPLRDGDVAGSLAAGIDRLDDSIRNGPPTGPLDDLADGPGSTWLPWVGLGLVLLGLVATAVIFVRRPRSSLPEMPPTTVRPDRDTAPALAAALVHGTPQASAVPAAILALAARDALVLEQEKEPGKLSKGTVQVRLLDRGLVSGEVEQAVWDQLVEESEDDLIDSGGLGKVARRSKPAREAVDDQLRDRGWLNPHHVRPRVALGAPAALGGLLLGGGIGVTAAGAPLMLVTVIPAGVLLLAAVGAALAFSRLSVAGRDAARPWEAYRDGLKEQSKDEKATVDLDAVLPDVIALGLGHDFEDRLDAATDPSTGTTLRAFTAPEGAQVVTNPVIAPWAAFSGVFTAGSGAGATVSGGGAGGGGGAAGST